MIWENWFAVVEQGITKEHLDANKNLTSLYNLNLWDSGREINYAVYRIN